MADEFFLSTNEKVALIGALCDQLRWCYGHGGSRADHIALAERLVEIAQTLPNDGDAA